MDSKMENGRTILLIPGKQDLKLLSERLSMVALPVAHHRLMCEPPEYVKDSWCCCGDRETGAQEALPLMINGKTVNPCCDHAARCLSMAFPTEYEPWVDWPTWTEKRAEWLANEYARRLDGRVEIVQLSRDVSLPQA